MTDRIIDSDLRDVDVRLAELSRQVEIDLQQKARLREELLRRHQELSAGYTQRAAGTLWPRFPRLKRLTLVAPAALAGALALGVALSALQLSGHPSPQAVEAARLQTALVRTVPSVTQWQMNVQQVRQDAATSALCQKPLNHGERLKITDHGSYLFTNGTWYQLTGTWYQVTPGAGTQQCAVPWQWAFALLPAHLASHDFTIVQSRSSGSHTDGIRFVLNEPNHEQIVATAWVDRTTGLVQRLERSVLQQGTVVERDVADYTYQRRP